MNKYHMINPPFKNVHPSDLGIVDLMYDLGGKSRPHPHFTTKRLILSTHNLSERNTEQNQCHSVDNSLDFLSRNYENFSTPLWGLGAWDPEWILLQWPFVWVPI